MLVLGIDDSGRGPIIGPMVLAGVLIHKEDETKLKKLGVKDSKKLTPKRREILAKEIKKYAKGFSILLAQPQEIDGRNAAGLNLNKLEAIKSAKIINTLLKEVKRTKL
jgi:ribonuclease HII